MPMLLNESSERMLKPAVEACVQGRLGMGTIAFTHAYAEGHMGAGRPQRSSIAGTSQLLRGKIKSHQTGSAKYQTGNEYKTR